MNLAKELVKGRVLVGILLTSAAALLPVGKAIAVPPTFWTGSPTTYTQNPVGSGQDVLVAGAVSLGRGQNNRLYNGIKETFHNTTSPTDTEWATATPGVIADLTTAATLTYTNFDAWVGGHAGFDAVANFIKNKHAVLHLMTENTYIAIDFSSWGAGFSGGFAYTRSTPAAIVPPSPTVSITSPTNNSTFAAPANITFKANASVSSGTVTNVAFFNGTTQLGSVQAAPFNFAANGLAAGSYALKAVATAGGVSTTSAVVNFSVVTPVAVAASSAGITNGQFAFNYSATPGLTYVVQNSSNLVTWLPLITNVPTTSTVQVSDPVNSNNLRFYRVGRVPNP